MNPAIRKIAVRGLNASYLGFASFFAGGVIHGDRPPRQDEPWIPIAMAAAGFVLGLAAFRRSLLIPTMVVNALFSLLAVLAVLTVPGGLQADWDEALLFAAAVHCACTAFTYLGGRRHPALPTSSAVLLIAALTIIEIGNDGSHGVPLLALPFCISAALAWLDTPTRPGVPR